MLLLQEMYSRQAPALVLNCYHTELILFIKSLKRFRDLKIEREREREREREVKVATIRYLVKRAFEIEKNKLSAVVTRDVFSPGLCSSLELLPY